MTVNVKDSIIQCSPRSIMLFLKFLCIQNCKTYLNFVPTEPCFYKAYYIIDSTKYVIPEMFKD